jgi:LytR_cpsA_psr family
LGRLLLAILSAALFVVATPLSTGPAHIQPADIELQPLLLADVGEPTPPPPSALPPAQSPRARARPMAEEESNFERLLRPFLNESQRARTARAAADPAYWTRVDRNLTAQRLNFLLFGYGETHEPPVTEREFIGSFTIFSYDYRSKSIDLVSLTHDIRAPEIERHLRDQGQQQVGPIKIDRAYGFGGFPLMRRTLEDATGLAIDFQVAFKEEAIAGATDRVFGGIEVDVPLAFDVNAFYMDGRKHSPGSFKQGLQRLDGMQVIQFIKTVPVEQNYDARLEHNARKHLVFRALMDSLRAQVGDIGFLGRGALFFTGEVAGRSIEHDFDVSSLLVENLWQLITDRRDEPSGEHAVPGIARTLYVVDPASGDGSVQWVRANAVTNPATQRDVAAGVYSNELAMELPYHGDPTAPDLISGYWLDVRQLIGRRLGS